MSLKAVYERYLADPSSAPLSPDVSLNYITTATAVHQADAVVNHLSSQKKFFKIKLEKILSATEGPGSLCLDVETTLQFVSGGGAYLPSLDGNLLTERVVTFPLIHIVRFDPQGRIQQIRLYWDQGSLLKQVDVIGSRGRNWPICDAQDQTRLITSATASILQSTDNAAPAQIGINVEKRVPANSFSPSKKAKDPHVLSLFSGQPQEDSATTPLRHSVKRPPRHYDELFVADPDKNMTPTKGSPARKDKPRAGAGKTLQQIHLFDDDETLAAEGSVKPINTTLPKAGASNHFRPSPLFVDDETQEMAEDSQTSYRPHPGRYSHFELGGDNSEREVKPIPSRPKPQHTSQWNFEDSSTVEKPRNKIRGQDIRHFGWSDDEGEIQKTPPARSRIIQPRRDAEPHFQFQDHATPGDDSAHVRIIGSAHNKGLGLYENNLYDEQGNPTPNEVDSKAPLSIVPNGLNRKKDFDSHWSISDDFPSCGNGKGEKKQIATDRLKAVKMMDASWDAYDETSEQTKTERAPAKPKLPSRNQRNWGFGDDDTV